MNSGISTVYIGNAMDALATGGTPYLPSWMLASWHPDGKTVWVDVFLRTSGCTREGTETWEAITTLPWWLG